MLLEIINQIKINVTNKFMVIERIKALITLEEDEKVDYWLEATFDEISLKSCKNETKRLLTEEKGYLVYGRNLTVEKFRELLNCFRSKIQIPKPIWWFEDLTKQEKETL